MAFRPPTPVPIKVGKRYRRKRQVGEAQSAGKILGGAALIGVAAEIGSVAIGQHDIATVLDQAKPLAASMGLVRARTPHPGDYWPGCDAARRAGSAPIYIGEPGYREGLDGDGDGIACEPYRR